MSAGDGFGRILLAEWTKLRSVNRWVITLLGAAVLTLGLGLLASSASQNDMNVHRNFVVGPHADPVVDDFFFLHQPVTGDATITVHVASVAPLPDRPMEDGNRPDSGPVLTRLPDTSPWSGPSAGLIIKDGTKSGSSYASVMLTQAHGVRMQSDFMTDKAGSASSGSRWLRLVRAGGTVTGYESSDGQSWQKIATMTPKDLPATAEIGFYVSYAPGVYTARSLGTSSVGERSNSANASFDSVQLGSTAASTAGEWQNTQVKGHFYTTGPKGGNGPIDGTASVAGGVYTVTGWGKIGPQPPDDDILEVVLTGVIAGLMALIALGVLYATSEYRKGMIRTTFIAMPRRGRVLAAKALVLGVTAYAVSLVAVVASFLIALPMAKSRGYAPPAFPTPSLMDGAVIRTLLLTAAFMAGVAVFAMAVGVLLRHSAAAITLTVVLVVLPLILGMILPGSSPRWLMYTTLAGGLATQRAKPPTVTLAEPWAMIGPWAGIGVVAAYVAVGLGLAWWQLRRRDA